MSYIEMRKTEWDKNLEDLGKWASNTFNDVNQINTINQIFLQNQVYHFQIGSNLYSMNSYTDTVINKKYIWSEKKNKVFFFVQINDSTGSQISKGKGTDAVSAIKKSLESLTIQAEVNEKWLF